MLNEGIGLTKIFREVIDATTTFNGSIQYGRYFFIYRRQRSHSADKDNETRLRRERGSVCKRA